MNEKLKSITDWFGDNRSTIELVAGVIGLTATVVVSAVESVKFVKKLEEKGLEPKDILDKSKRVEVLKTGICSFKYGLITYTASVICIGDAKRIDANSIRSLTTTLDVTTRSLHNIRNEIVETMGEKKLRELEDGIAEKQAIAGPPKNEVVPVIFPEATTVFHDIPTGRWFKSSPDRINSAINAMDTELNANDGKVPVSDWLDLLGLDGGGVWDSIYILGCDFRKCEFANTTTVSYSLISDGISVGSIDYYIYDSHGKEYR